MIWPVNAGTKTNAINSQTKHGAIITRASHPLPYTNHGITPMPDTPPIRLVLTTCATPDEARRLARSLVEEQLAACVTLIPAVESIYRWQGKIESSTETLLILKTVSDQLPALETRLHALHSYEVPEFLVLDIESASHPYLQWLQSCLHKC